MEFPEFRGSSRRDYWLDICLEILYAHRFIRKNNLKEIQKSEILAKAILGIFRYRAVREAFRFSSSHYKTLLAFNLAESLPGGDKILETLSSRLTLLNDGAGIAKRQSMLSPTKQQPTLSPVSLLALSQLGFVLEKEANLDGQAVIIGDICVGETNPLELAVKQSLLDTGMAEAAQATVDQVKVEGIDTNVAVMKVNYDYTKFAFPIKNTFIPVLFSEIMKHGKNSGNKELTIVKCFLRNKTIFCAFFNSFLIFPARKHGQFI